MATHSRSPMQGGQPTANCLHSLRPTRVDNAGGSCTGRWPIATAQVDRTTCIRRKLARGSHCLGQALPRVIRGNRRVTHGSCLRDTRQLPLPRRGGAAKGGRGYKSSNRHKFCLA
ncbi:hypothetical protein GW17_00029731 [Ensete ventricosum]|nr:hypothetical protein GW17_00029731 [Ensete ventricosum]